MKGGGLLPSLSLLSLHSLPRPFPLEVASLDPASGFGGAL